MKQDAGADVHPGSATGQLGRQRPGFSNVFSRPAAATTATKATIITTNTTNKRQQQDSSDDDLKATFHKDPQRASDCLTT